MSTRESNEVVNQDGKVWGTDGRYIPDTSVFLSASHANPMTTSMAIRDWISRRLIQELATSHCGILASGMRLKLDIINRAFSSVGSA